MKGIEVQILSSVGKEGVIWIFDEKGNPKIRIDLETWELET